MNEKYVHVKTGNLYELLFIAKETEAAESVVVYRALYGTRQVWVRPYNDFFAKININGEKRGRFELACETVEEFVPF